jgi:pheromone shutdown-related protein TraB
MQSEATRATGEITPSEPVEDLQLGGTHVVVLGTAHVSQTSADAVARLIAEGDFDAVAVELCPSRYHALLDPDALSRMDLFAVVRSGKASMAAAQLALGAYQQRLADQFGIEPGAEMRMAVGRAREASASVLLIDREIGVTLRRVLSNVPWWKRAGLVVALLASVLSREEVSEDEIERLKEGDVLETSFAEFAEDRKELYEPLIQERDLYMAARIIQEIEANAYKKVLAVVGAGHLKGIAQSLRDGVFDPQREIDRLDTLPPPNHTLRLIPWLIAGLVVAGFVIGFNRNPDLGWQLVADWVLINGGLSALGTVLAMGHPLSVLTAFVAAPFTSLNPAVGAGMVTAGVELYLRRPAVGDFMSLRKDTVHWRGWWRNRVSRTLLVFLFSTLGSAAGTYLAGFRIFGRLAS